MDEKKIEVVKQILKLLEDNRIGVWTLGIVEDANLGTYIELRTKGEKQ